MFIPLKRAWKSINSRPERPAFQPWLEALEDRCLLSVDPILEWNAVALQVNQTSYSGFDANDQAGPTRSSRALAIVHVAMFDAWNSINNQFTPYLTKAPNANNASDEAAVAQAAHDTLVALYPHEQALIDTALAQSLARISDGKREARGIAVGQYVAQQILQSRVNDGSQIPGSYVPDGLPGHHQPDPNNPGQGFLTPAWGNVTPFAIPSTAAIPTPTVPGLDTTEYTQAYDQVEQLGSENSTERTTDETELAIFWGYDVARGLGDPPRLFNQIARVVAVQENNSVAQNARLFALLNVAMADAGIQCWGVKYRDIFWRPIVAIHDGNADGNPATVGDPSWNPLGAPRTNPLPGEINFTPPFPSYTSGHATFGGAAFKTLADFYGTDDVNFSIPFDFISDEFNGVSRDIHDAIPDLILNHVRKIAPRHFTSFSQAAAEVSASRIFLGIHWRFDAIQGVSAGDRIADYAFDNVMLPKQGHPPMHVPTADFVSQIDAYLNGTYTTYFATGAPTPATANERFVNQVYLTVLHRPAEPQGMAYWSGLLDHGTSQTDVANGIVNSLESRQNMVQDMYHHLLHRDADPTGLRDFAAFLGSGGTIDQAQSIIMTSQEYVTRNVAQSNGTFLEAVYNDMLGRSVDAAGRALFETALNAGVPRQQIAHIVCTSTEFRQNMVAGFYQDFLYRTPDAQGLNSWMDAMATGSSMQALMVEFLTSQEFMGRL
jgi:hypothetical protein